MGYPNRPVLVVTCIDYRFQDYINGFMQEKGLEGKHDRVALKGGVHPDGLTIVLEHVEFTVEHHGVELVILINHEDCGAYGNAGTSEGHSRDLINAADEIRKRYPHVKVEAYFVSLDGEFDRVV